MGLGLRLRGKHKRMKVMFFFFNSVNVKVVNFLNGVNVIVFESVNMYENNNFKSRDVIYDGIVKKHNCGYTLVKFKNVDVVNLNSAKVFKNRQFL